MSEDETLQDFLHCISEALMFEDWTLLQADQHHRKLQDLFITKLQDDNTKFKEKLNHDDYV